MRIWNKHTKVMYKYSTKNIFWEQSITEYCQAAMEFYFNNSLGQVSFRRAQVVGSFHRERCEIIFFRFFTVLKWNIEEWFFLHRTRCKGCSISWTTSTSSEPLIQLQGKLVRLVAKICDAILFYDTWWDVWHYII